PRPLPRRVEAVERAGGAVEDFFSAAGWEGREHRDRHLGQRDAADGSERRGWEYLSVDAQDFPHRAGGEEYLVPGNLWHNRVGPVEHARAKGAGDFKIRARRGAELAARAARV